MTEQKQKRSVTASFEGRKKELDRTNLAAEIGSFAKSQGVQTFEVSASSGGEFKRVSSDRIQQLQDEIQEVRLYRVEKAG